MTLTNGNSLCPVQFDLMIRATEYASNLVTHTEVTLGAALDAACRRLGIVLDTTTYAIAILSLSKYRERMEDRRDSLIASIAERHWVPKLFESSDGPIEVFLHLRTGWVLYPATGGWIAAHSISQALVTHSDGSTRVWTDKTVAQVELALTCPDCYAVELPAPCATCNGTGRLGVSRA